MARPSLRPRGFDDLGLRRALGDRVLPLLVAAMAFLAALAVAGSVGAAGLARHWDEGAAAALTAQVPHPGTPLPGAASAPEETRLQRAVSILRGTPGIASVRPLTEDELSDLLRPWLGSTAESLSLPLPAVIEVHLAGGSLLGGAPALDLAGLARRLEQAVPGTLVESHGIWVQRLSGLARSLQAVAWAALAVVACVAAGVIAVATRAGLVARRDAIEIVHGLGATDGYIAGRFARRATALAGGGGALGALAALPVLVGLAAIAAPFAGGAEPEAASGLGRAALPVALWLALPALPMATAAIGWLTAQGTVRSWLRRLP